MKKIYTNQICPAEVRRVGDKISVMSIDQFLCLPEDEMPMKLTADYSRFVVVLMNNQTETGGMQNPTANIKLNEIPGIYHKTKWCNEKFWEYELRNISQEENSPAYSVKLTGKMAGKTPVQILTELGDTGVQTLLAQKKWLESNLSGKFAESNKQQIGAIDEAIGLFKTGKMKKDCIIPQIMVNEPIRKFFREKKSIGGKEYNKVYVIRITFDIARKYPYTVSIKNSYNSIETAEDGTKRIGNENLEAMSGEIKLTVGQWTNYVDIMYRRLMEHEVVHYAYQEKKANMMKNNSKKVV